MSRSTRLRSSALLLLLLPVAACGDDGGTPKGDTGPIACPEGHFTRPDGSCYPAGPGCTVGLDTNADGWCDRTIADWSREARVPSGTTREDIYGVGDQLDAIRTAGYGHALVWPVDVSGVLLPWRPIAVMFDPAATDRTTRSMQNVARRTLGFGNLDEMYDWLGLPRASGPTTVQGYAWPEGIVAGTPLGAGRIPTERGEALTFSCATCHTAQVFGKTVAGMTNRMSRANEFFHSASEFFPSITPGIFEDLTDATEEELAQFVRTQGNLRTIGNKIPEARGLDTSLAQVSLSLARREADQWATKNPELEANPRPNALAEDVADSKPAVWWTLKYKTRWLSDGSIVSGNPIYTNFLWNEIGRGTDLLELENWLEANRDVVDELTVAAFATSAPHWTDFFPASSIDIDAAKRGADLYETHCASCHGSWDKNWDRPDAAALSEADRLKSTRLWYHEQTPVLDVGTDPLRAQGMAAFAQRLNELRISQYMETVVEVQTGYVPPPLDGIWLRYPYLHNGSVPTLCDLLLPASRRTAVWWMGPSDDAATDFDADCVGFPTGDRVPASWKADSYNTYDTSREGMSNQGHDEWLTLPDGSPALDDAERMDLIEFLKTL